MRQLVTVLYRSVRIPKVKSVSVEGLPHKYKIQLNAISSKHFHSCSLNLKNSKKEDNFGQKSEEDNHDDFDAEDAAKSALTTDTYFNSAKRNKETFEVMLDIYKKKNLNRKGVVEFIYAALKHMDDYKVAYDLQTYKKLIELMPEGKYVPENFYSEAFFHYPKQQDCVITVLDTMELKGVCPDKEMVEIIKKRFGERGQPLKKVYRQLYWFPKFKNASPWPVPWPPVFDRFTLTKLAVERIVSVDPQSEVQVFQTKDVPDSIDDTYVVSGQSPKQQKLLAEHPTSKSLFVEGAFRIWVGKASVNYFILRADPKEFKEVLEDPDDVTNISVPFLFEKPKEIIEKPSVHEQKDGTILAVCATGTSSRDTLLSWIRLLEKNGNPALAEIPVIFSLRAPVGDIIAANQDVPPHSEEEPERVSEK